MDVMAGKRVLVIGGGGGGIGRAITRRLAAGGAAVAVADLDGARSDEAVAELEKAGARAIGLDGDVRAGDTVDRFVADAAAGLGGLDGLVTVVGGQAAFAPFVPLHEVTDDDWDLMFDVNLRYVARAVRSALRVFLAQGGGGTIVSVGSITGSMGAPSQAAYGAAKAGLASLARTVGAEYAGHGIRMNVVECGAIITPVSRAAGNTDESDDVPMGRLGTAEEVAEAALFLASPLSSYVTGQCVVLDGGVSVRGPFPTPPVSYG
jgi:3-oxoacyl-[acyl-carrier protein] reductase